MLEELSLLVLWVSVSGPDFGAQFALLFIGSMSVLFAAVTASSGQNFPKTCQNHISDILQP